MNRIDQVYEAHGAALLRHATVLVGPHDAADLVADVVVASLSDRRWAKAQNPLAYLHRSLLNAARMRHRANSRRVSRELKSSFLGHVEAPLLSNPDILEAVACLSPQQRAVIYFTYWEDLRPAEIALNLGIGDGTVKRHLARARKSLKEALHEYQHAPK